MKFFKVFQDPRKCPEVREKLILFEVFSNRIFRASSDRIVQSNLRGLDNPKFKDDNGIERTHWKNKVTPDNEVQKVERLDPEDLHFYVRSWGPYRSSFYAVDIFDTYDELFLIAAGSGFGFILSAITLLG